MFKSDAAFLKRAYRVRNKLKKVAKGKHRLSVFRSNQHIYTQIIDDSKGCTVLSVNSSSDDFKNTRCSVKVASEIGKKVGELSLKKGIKQVVFDKGGYYYHGKVKAIADGAREAGLKI
ncbi:MAG: 50S ribosomal protein L18 [Alphaproteobacteria bacterium]|nr:50S ribosomal protein L18 [Alphaproteobacteria bacterium]